MAMEDERMEEDNRDLDISSALHPSVDDIENMRKSLKSRPWIIYDKLESEGKPDAKELTTSLSADVCLPKGVSRGCSKCSDCQKVSARWNPERVCSYDLKEAPVFHPSYEEFNDTSNYIDSIRQQVEPYGFCLIVPPPSWIFPCFLDDDNVWQNFKFTPQTQQVNKPQNHHSYTEGPSKRRKLDCESSDNCAANFSSGECHEAESYKFESSPEFTLVDFKTQADYFKRCYFSKDDSVVANGHSSPNMQLEKEPPEHDIEGEYWRIVEKPTEDIEVLYVAQNFGCGSPAHADTESKIISLKSTTSGWNLECISSLPGSLLLLEESDSSSILKPQLHIGMCFSSVPWNVAEHCLYKMDYLHLGSPRIWYGISGGDAHKFEAATKKHTPKLLEKRPKLLHKGGPNLSIGTLESESIPVYRCIQRPGDMILFLPRAYHAGVDCGFNCSSSAVFAPMDWLPHGLTCTELYREHKRKTSVSFDKLLLCAANEAVKARWDNLVRGQKTSNITTWKQASGKDGVITKVLKVRTRSEARYREYISPASQSKKMDKSFDTNSHKKECSICYYDLYLSAATCLCNPSKYSCLLHAKHLCSCPWTDKVFLFRYEVTELNMLLEAVEGKITPMRVWIKENLGCALEWDKDNPNQGENGVGENSEALSDSKPSYEKDVPLEKDQGFEPKSCSDEKEPVFEELFSDDFKAKAIKFILKNSNDDDDDNSSSSSSDFDIDACIADLESKKKEPVPAVEDSANP